MVPFTMRTPAPHPPRAELNDETLRDGIQSPSVRHPELEAKASALRAMHRLGVKAASLGLPAAGIAQRTDVEALLRTVIDEKLDLEVHCAGRTRVEDLAPVADIQQRVGGRLGVYAFLGSSPVRRYAEGWALDDLIRGLEEALGFAAAEGLEVAFVTEDTVRSRPEELRRMFEAAIGLGVRRLVLCDTVGYATPRGTQRLVRFVRGVIAECGEAVALDWHGHDDRGLAVANSLAAEAAGVDRLHGTMLGIGERCGNAALDQLIRHRDGGLVDDEALNAYRDLVCSTFDWPLPAAYPWPDRPARPRISASR